MKIVCKFCKNKKEKSDFSESNLNKKTYKCKSCANLYAKKYREKNKQLINKKIRQWYKENKNKVKETKAKYLSKNKKIISEKLKKYRDKNKQKIKLRQQVYYINNKHKLLNAAKKYYIENKNKINKNNNIYYKNRRKVDVNFKIRAAVSASINYYLRNKNLSKNGSSVGKYLPYSIQELKTHLESMFEPWMNWNNYGKFTKFWDDNDSSTWTWQIDHIKPQSNYRYQSMVDDEFKECWSLSNLRPLSSKQNFMDGVTRVRHTK